MRERYIEWVKEGDIYRKGEREREREMIVRVRRK